MAMCNFCGKPFSWGINEGKYTPLVPVGEDEGLDRIFQDENGELRAEHRAVCTLRGGPTVRVSRLARTVKGDEVLPRKLVDVTNLPEIDPQEINHG